MAKTSWARWIPIGLLVVALLALAMHVREIVRTGLAQVPVYAAPMGSHAYPIVGGNTVETRGSSELEVGDRLIRVGDRDLRGTGYLGFMGHVYAEAGTHLRAPLVYERDGERHGTVLELSPFAFPWLRLPFLSMMLLLVALMLARRPDVPFIRFTGMTFAAVVIGESVFEGGGVAQTTIAKLVFILGGAVWWPLVIYFVARFPHDRAGRPLARGLPLVAATTAALWTLPKLMYVFGGPVPSSVIPSVVSGADALTIAFPAGLFIMSYRRFDEAERRRVRSVVYSAWAAGLSMFVALMIPVITPDFPYFGEMLAAAAVAAAMIPIGLTIAIIGYDLFDVDRLLSAAATYSLLLVTVLAMLLTMVPPVAAILAGAFGADPETSRISLSLLAASAAIPLNRWLQPRIEHLFFPERRRIETGIDALISAQERVTDAGELAVEVASRIGDLFRPRFSAALVRKAGVTHGRWRVAAVDGELDVSEPSSLQPPPALVRMLAERSTPVVIGERDPTNARSWPASALGEFMATSPPALLLPIRERDRLMAIIAVGPKRSGDVFSPTELALLSAALEAAARHLGLVRGAEALARERVRSEALEAAHLTRSRYLAAASHDLRQPLHALRLFSEAIQDRANEPEISDLALRIGASAVALHEMFDALIDLSRIDQGALAPDVQVFEIRSLFDRLRSETELAATRKQLVLEVVAPDVSVRSDPVLLGRVVQNLLTNAVRYTDAGRVTLAADRVDGLLRICVRDTGPGIPESRREEVFEEFVRLETDKSTRGLGLGLAIVRRLCDLLDHPLSLESEPGQGSEFSIDVPIERDVMREVPPSAAPMSELAGVSVLIVDDDLDVLGAMRSLLEGWGAHVTLASSGEEALEACADREREPSVGGFDVVLADFRLRGEEQGADVIGRVRAALGRDVPAVVITGSSSSEVVRLLDELGLPMLPKPVSPARLRATLGGLLARRR